MARRFAFALCVAVALGVALWLALRVDDGERRPPSAPDVTTRDSEELALTTPSALGSERSTPATPIEGAAIISGESPAGAPARVTLFVHDAQRQPIVGARATTFEDTAPGSFETDASGRIALPIAPDEKRMARLLVEAAGFFHAPTVQWCRAEIEVRLARTTTLRGHVLERETRRPIAGARVEHSHQLHKTCAPEACVSDASGKFELPGVPVELNHDEPFVVIADGFSPQNRRLRITEANALVEHEIFLDSGIEITGEVVDFETRLPLADVLVIQAPKSEIARTTADGRFSGRAVTARASDRIELRFSSDGYCILRREWAADELGPDRPVRAPLPRSARLRGVVRDEQGNPAHQVQLFLTQDEPKRDESSGARELGPLTELSRDWRIGTVLPGRERDTDTSGSFEKELVPYSGAVKIWSLATDRGRVETQSITPGRPGDEQSIELVLRHETYGTIAGRVLLNGTPVRGWASWKGASRWDQVETKKDGQFALERVETGRVTLKTWHDFQFSDAFMRTEELDVAPGARIERDCDLVVALAPIAGRVVRADGMPAKGVTVRVDESSLREGRFSLSHAADADGRFELRVPAAVASYTASVRTNEHRYRVDGIRPGDRDVEIVLTNRPIVLCRAVDASSRESIGRSDVYARRDTARPFELVSEPGRTAGSDGWMRVPLEAGTWTLQARATQVGYLPCTLDSVVVDRSGETRIELPMTRGATLELRFAQGVKPWSQFDVVLLLDEGIAEALERMPELPLKLADATDLFHGIDPERDRVVDFADREFALVRGLAPGRYRFYETRRSIAFDPEEIVISSHSNQRATLGWHRR